PLLFNRDPEKGAPNVRAVEITCGARPSLVQTQVHAASKERLDAGSRHETHLVTRRSWFRDGHGRMVGLATALDLRQGCGRPDRKVRPRGAARYPGSNKTVLVRRDPTPVDRPLARPPRGAERRSGSVDTPRDDRTHVIHN